MRPVPPGAYEVTVEDLSEIGGIIGHWSYQSTWEVLVGVPRDVCTMQTSGASVSNFEWTLTEYEWRDRPGWLTESEFRGVTEIALGAWNRRLGADYFRYAGDCEPLGATPGVQTIAVRFEAPTGVLATGGPVDGIAYSYRPAAYGCHRLRFMAGALVHEFGHVLGLVGHSHRAGDMMHASPNLCLPIALSDREVSTARSLHERMEQALSGE